MECFHRVQAKNQSRRAETSTSELRVAENVVMPLCRRSSIERHAGRVRTKLYDTPISNLHVDVATLLL